MTTKYIKKKLKKSGQNLEQLLGCMDDLRYRPMMLSYIDDLIRIPDAKDKLFVYTYLINKWLSREINNKVYAVNISRWDLLSACVSIAKSMSQNGVEYIDESHIEDVLKNGNHNNDITSEHLRVRSLLIRDTGNRFRFAHTHLLNYLVRSIYTRDGAACTNMDFKMVSPGNDKALELASNGSEQQASNLSVVIEIPEPTSLVIELVDDIKAGALNESAVVDVSPKNQLTNVAVSSITIGSIAYYLGTSSQYFIDGLSFAEAPVYVVFLAISYLCKRNLDNICGKNDIKTILTGVFTGTTGLLAPAGIINGIAFNAMGSNSRYWS